MRFVVPSPGCGPLARSWLLVAALTAHVACTGSIGAGGSDRGGDATGQGGRAGAGATGAKGGTVPGGGSGPEAAACKDESPGVPTLRRLTSAELAATLKTLLGRDVNVAWPQDELVSGYASARDNAVLEPHARLLYTDLLPALRDVVNTSAKSLSGACATLGAACASSLVDGFASRAWRRAPSQDEKTALQSFYDEANTTLGDPKEATANLLLAILSSPSFLYRAELGGAAGSDGARRLSSREIGSALSYFFIGQPPDATLLAKIAADGFKNDADITAEIDRLRATPAHAAWMARFFQQWTQVQDLASKDHALDKYPDATGPYEQEAEDAFVRQVSNLISDPKSTFVDLIAGKSFVAGPLTAKAYVSGAKPAALTSVTTDGDRRGLFMTVGFLSAYSKPDRPASVQRGRFLVTQAMCIDLPGIPANALQRMFTPDPNKSPRQNFEEFTSSSACSGCHQMLNPIGFSFDAFGGDGQRLTQLDGFPIKTAGTVDGTGALDGALAGPQDLVMRLAQSSQARECLLRQWFRFTNGRAEDEPDECTFRRLLAKMTDDGDTLSTFARNYFTSRNFLYRQDRGAP